MKLAGTRGLIVIANVRQPTENRRGGDPSGRETTSSGDSAELPRIREPRPMRLRSRPKYPARKRTPVPGLSELVVSREEGALWARLTLYWATKASRDLRNPVAGDVPGPPRSKFLRPSRRPEQSLFPFSYILQILAVLPS
jgi:hypothetical protein